MGCETLVKLYKHLICSLFTLYLVFGIWELFTDNGNGIKADSDGGSETV
jgi:hypothetical protein